VPAALPLIELCPEALEELLESAVPGVVLVPLCDWEEEAPGFWLLLSADGLLGVADGVAPEFWLLLVCSPMKLLCGTGAGVVFGVLAGVLFGFEVPVGGFSLMLPEDEVELAPLSDADGVAALGEDGAVLDELLLVVLELLPVEDAAAPAPAAVEAALATVSSSFTFLTPETDFAIFLASFLASFEGTEPVKATAPLSALTWTFEKSGLVANWS